MSIIIKELFSSDPLSEALDKINFNFDQIVLSGGGPPGPQGDKGPQGIAGPKGDDGSHWFSGDDTPLNPLNGDYWLKTNGTVWKYSSSTSTWNITTIYLIGPTGVASPSSSSMEIKLYAGRTAGALAGSQNSWMIEPSVTLTTDDTSPNFLVPINSNKNSLFLGSLDLSNSNFKTWNSIDVVKGTAPSTRMISKMTMIQNEMDYTGYGGLTIGAKGATSTIIDSTSVASNNTILGAVTNTFIDSRDFFNAGYYIKSPRTDANIYIDQSAKYTHGFLLSMYTMDLDIQAGTKRLQPLHNLLGNNKIPSINLKSYRIHLEDFERNRTLYSGYSLLSNNNASSYIEINSKNLATNIYIDDPGVNAKTFGYVGLQTQQNTIPTGYAHNYGSVLIGGSGAAAYPITQDNRAALNISRPITKVYNFNDATSLDSHITLWSGTETSADSYIARISGVRDPLVESGSGYLQILSRKIGFAPRLTSTIGGSAFSFAPRFGFHVITKDNELFGGINSTGFIGQGTPNSQILGVIAGFNSVSGNGSTANSGLGIINYRSTAQTWYTGATPDGNIPTHIGINTYWSGPSAGRWDKRNNPDLHLQVGEETTHGNVIIGFVASPTSNTGSDLKSWSKLTVAGSLTVAANTSYFNGNTNRPTNGILSEGNILSGSPIIGNYFPTTIIGITGPTTIFLKDPGEKANSFAYLMSTNPNLTTIKAIEKQIGIATTKDVLSSGYVAVGRQSLPASSAALGSYASLLRTNPSYSLADYRTGMDMQIMSEGLLVVNNSKNYVVGVSGGTSTQDLTKTVPKPTKFSDIGSIPAAKFSMRTDFTGLTGAGFQVTSRFAVQPRYMNLSQLEPLVKPYYGAIHRKNMPLKPGKIIDMQWEGFYLPLPTDRSILVLDLIHAYNNVDLKLQYSRYKPHRYNQNVGLVALAPGVTSNYPTMNSWLPPSVEKVNGVGGPAYGLANLPRNISTLQYNIGADTKIVRPSNFFVTLDDGLYDGQEFTLIITRCIPANEVTMVGSPVPTTLSSVWKIDDGLPDTGKLPAGMTAYIYDIQKTFLSHDFVDTTTTNTFLPYGVPSGTNVNDFTKYTKLANWNANVINNSGQILASQTGTSPNIQNIGDYKATGLSSAKGSFKFKRGRSITFKWVRVLNGNALTTKLYTNPPTEQAHLLSSNGNKTSADTVTTPIPNVVQDYARNQTAPICGGVQYAWVEVARNYSVNTSDIEFFVLPGL